MHIGFYAGSFDPMTNGHLDVLRAAAVFCDRLVVGIGVHPGKAPVFTAAERADLIRSVWTDAQAKLEIVTFDGLAVDAAAKYGAQVLIRGLRDGTDLDYEMQMAGMNAKLAPAIETIFIPAKVETRHITATLVRQIAAMGGDITAFVPPVVAAAFAARRTLK